MSLFPKFVGHVIINEQSLPFTNSLDTVCNMRIGDSYVGYMIPNARISSNIFDTGTVFLHYGDVYAQSNDACA